MKKLLFVITQLYKGGAETALVNLLSSLSPEDFEIDLIILNQYPVENAISLVPELPQNVNVFDQWSHAKRIPFLSRINRKIRYVLHGELQYPAKAIRYVKNKEYDWAFHVGEWSSPEFLAKHVHAHTKAVWIHTDISKSTIFDANMFFRYGYELKYYIFVSQNSLNSSIEKYPQIKGKSVYIHNMLDDKSIKSKADAFIPYTESLPVIVTCANIRPEKNHMRQIEVMSLLRNKGIKFKWLNLGSSADIRLYKQLLGGIEKCNLSQDFKLVGAIENPYPYMKNATAVAVLSDYESWSLVITEAKILGVPVIATKTSGAIEQIEHNKTGILCEFNTEDIAAKIERLLNDFELQNKIRRNIAGFDSRTDTLYSFKKLIDSDVST